MTDIHCHILPGIDDGARSLSEALEMVRLAVRSGVTDLVATPHFPGDSRATALFPKILGRLQLLQQAVQRENLPIRLYPGAEVLCTPETLELARKKLLPTLGNTQYVLTEFYFDEPFEVMDDILTGITAWGYIPVIAHPERYEAICFDPRGIEDWFRRGWIIQVNKGSILGAFGYREQQTAQWLLGAGLVHIIASDAHSSFRRTPDMSPLLQALEELVPEEYTRILTIENPSRLIRGLAMTPAE